MSILPDEIMEQVNSKFTTKAQKNIATELLTVWKRKPTWTEMTVIGDRYGRKEKAVKIVMDRLMESDLFTENEGSMYLYKLQLKKEANPLTSMPSLPFKPSPSTHSPPSIPPKEGENEPKEEELPPPVVTDKEEENKFSWEREEETPAAEEPPSEDLPALRNKVLRIEAQLDSLGKKLDKIIPALEVVSAQTTENPLNVDAPPVEEPEEEEPEVVKPEVESSESVEALIKRTIMETLNEMQTDNPIEAEVAAVEEANVILPSIDLETENPLEDAVDSIIELEGHIISKKMIGFTSKSLLLFDLVRKKGFRGNLADYVNSSISSAMKGRKFKLVVEEDVE